MAYKFQVGNAQLSGALTQEGTIRVRDQSGVLQGHITDAGELSASADLKAGGDLDVEGDADIAGSDIRLTNNLGQVTVRGDFAVRQEATFDSKVTLGNSNNDRVIFEADVSSSLIPSDDSAFDIGADTERWANIYGDTIVGAELSGALKFDLQHGPGIKEVTFDNTNNGTIAVSGAADLDPYRITMWSAGDDKFVNSVLIDDGSSILTLDSGYDFEATLGNIKALSGELSASADLKAGGGLDVEGNADIAGQVSLAALGVGTSVRGTLGVKQDAAFEANVTLGNNNSDRVIFEADVSSSLIPSDDSAFDIGSNGFRWKEIYGDTIVGAELSGALKFNLQEGPGIKEFTFDNTNNATVQVSGAADLDPYRITMWSAGDDKFVNSVLIDDGANKLTLDSNYNFEATRGDIKALDGNVSASADLKANGGLEIVADAEIGGNGEIGGTLDVSGEARFDNHVTLGSNVASNVVEYKAAVSSSIFPSHTDSWDLGSDTYRWDQIYAREIHAGSIFGNIAFDVETITGNSQIADTTELALCSATLAPITVTMPEITADGQVVRVKRISSSTRKITVEPDSVAGDSFDDGSPIELETLGAAITCVSSGSTWYII